MSFEYVSYYNTIYFFFNTNMIIYILDFVERICIHNNRIIFYKLIYIYIYIYNNILLLIYIYIYIIIYYY